MKKNVFFAGMPALLLAFGMAAAGCATFKMDEGSITQEKITLEIVDLKAYAAEKGLYGEIKAPAGGGFAAALLSAADGDAVRRTFANDPERYLVQPQLVAVATAKGYTKQNGFASAWIDLNKAMPSAESPVYPEAMVYTFTETDNKGVQRQSIQIRTFVPAGMQSYQVRQLRPATGAASATSDMVGVFPTQAEADRYAEEYKRENPTLADRITAVGSYTPSEGTLVVSSPDTSSPNYMPSGTIYYAAFKE